MRLFGIEADGAFREFVKTPFQSNHEEAVLESWLECNPNVVEDGEFSLISYYAIGDVPL